MYTFEGDRPLDRLVAAIPLRDAAGAGALVLIKPLDEQRADLAAIRRAALLSLLTEVAAVAFVG